MRVETIEYRGLLLELHVDDDPQDCREWSNLGTMVCFHGRYTLGDAHEFGRSKDYAGWADVKRAILARHPGAVILPIYLYDHSGLTVSTEPFSCPWDSGQVGYIYADLPTLRKEYSRVRIGKVQRRHAAAVLKGEVETYDQYIRGDVWGFVVTDEEGNHLDSCWGHYGQDYCLECAKESADWHAERREGKAA